MEKRLLLAGASMPALYFAVLFGFGALYPDYSHVRQVASDLGADGARYDWALPFNIGLILVGVAGIAGALGLFQGLLKLGSGSILALATSVVIFLPSVNMVMSGAFPLPSPWHSNIYLLLVGNLAPLLGALALRKIPGTTNVMVLLVIAFAVNMGITAALFGVGNLINEDNLGLWLRIWAVAILPAMGFLFWTVRARL